MSRRDVAVQGGRQRLAHLWSNLDAIASEAALETAVIKPLLRELGYGEADWQDQVPLRHGRVDFLLPGRAATPYRRYLAIEVKAPRQDLTRHTWQLSRYLRDSGSLLGVLTNGYSFRVFYHYGGEVKFLAEFQGDRLLSDEEEYQRFGRLFCKQNCERVMAAFEGMERRVHNRFTEAIARLFQDRQLIRLLHQSDRDQLARDQTRRTSMIITVFNNKGGVGKTTLTINLAAALNRLGKRVLLVDIDPQANLTMGLGIDPLTDVERLGRKDVTHWLTEAKTSLEEVRIAKRWTNLQLDVVPSHIRLSDMEATLIQTVDVDRVLARKLKAYRDEYDYIFIDPPPSFGKVNTISLMASAAVLIPTQLAPYPIRALEYVMNRAFSVDDAREEPLAILGIAVSMYDRTSKKLSLEMREEIERVLSQDPRRKTVELFPESTWIPRLNVVSTSPKRGLPLCEFEFEDEVSLRDREAALDAFTCYTQLAEHLLAVG